MASEVGEERVQYWCLTAQYSSLKAEYKLLKAEHRLPKPENRLLTLQLQIRKKIWPDKLDQREILNLERVDTGDEV